MANITENDDWASGVYQYADGDVLDGGPTSTETLPFRQLAGRSLYQRLRNVTPWDGMLAAATGYPTGACVFHGGSTWRAKVLNNVEPGTDPAKWERWGYSESELAAYLAENLLPYGPPIACPNQGPVAGADTARVHKSALGEYWMWLGDVWGVVWNRYGQYHNNGANGAVVGNGSTTLITMTMPRAGVISATVSAHRESMATGNTLDCSIDLNAQMIVSDAIVASSVGHGMFVSGSIEVPVTAGAVVRCMTYSNYSSTARTRASIYYKN